jgi:hypothetical protein
MPHFPLAFLSNLRSDDELEAETLLLIWDKAVRRLAIVSLPALRLSARSIRRAWDGDDGAIAEVNLSRPEILMDT